MYELWNHIAIYSHHTVIITYDGLESSQLICSRQPKAVEFAKAPPNKLIEILDILIDLLNQIPQNFIQFD
jgi:hypothetical protein